MKVYKIDKTGNIEHVYDSVAEAAFRTGVSKQAIYAAVKGLYMVAGFVWDKERPMGKDRRHRTG